MGEVAIPLSEHPALRDPPYALHFHRLKLCISSRLPDVTEEARREWLDRNFPFAVMMDSKLNGRSHKINRAAANQFAHDHCEHAWMVIGYEFFFEDQKEAAIFRLHWG